MGCALITYLSTRVRIGLHPNIGRYLPAEIEFSAHLRRVIDAYGSIILENEQAIERNANRFKLALAALLDGVWFISTAGVLYFGITSEQMALIGVVGAIAIAVIFTFVIIQDRFMTISAHSDDI